MTAALRFDPIRLPPECEKLRQEVRAFLAEEIAAGSFNPFQPLREMPMRAASADASASADGSA